MQLRATRAVSARAAVFGLAVVLAGCAGANDAATQAVKGGLIGAGIGAGVGAAFAINPAIGVVAGAAGGGVLGAASGALSAPPPVTYGPIAPQDTAFAPGFYDGWPPSYHSLPIGAAAPPPPRG